MFIPDGSIRAGVVNDLVAETKDDDGFVQTLTLVLALITLIPSGGASLAIAAGGASIGLTVYSAGKAWEKFKTGKTLTNTDLDLARSLSDKEPSLTEFAVSLVALGLEGLPLIGAFNKARKIKSLANAAGDIRRAEQALKAQEALKEAVDDPNALETNGVRHNLGDQALRASRAETSIDDTAATLKAVRGEDAVEKATEVELKGGVELATEGGHVHVTEKGRVFSCHSPCTEMRAK